MSKLTPYQRSYRQRVEALERFHQQAEGLLQDLRKAEGHVKCSLLLDDLFRSLVALARDVNQAALDVALLRDISKDQKAMEELRQDSDSRS